MSDTEKPHHGKLDTFARMVAQRDPALVDELWGEGDFIMVGSEHGEICRTRPELQARLAAIFATPATYAFAWPTRRLTLAGTAAWIFAEGHLTLKTPGKPDLPRPYLALCIFEYAGGHWRWRQFFGSEPA